MAGSIKSIDDKTPALGQAKAAASRPVVIASDQPPLTAYVVDSDELFPCAVTPHGEQTTQTAIQLVGQPFVGTTLDTNFWSTAGQSGTGATAIVNGIATLTTGATANSVAVLSTVKPARFLFPHANRFRAAVRTPDAGTTLNVRRWGVGDGTNVDFGFVLSGSGAQNFGVFYRTAAGSIVDLLYGFNGRLGTNPQKLWTTDPHLLEILYFTTGTYWYLDGVLLHKIVPYNGGSPPAAYAAPTFSALSQAIRVSNTNSGGSTTITTCDVWNAAVLRLGPEKGRPISAHIAGAGGPTVYKYGPGTLHRVIIGGAGVGSSITLIDNVTGSTPVIGILTTTTVIASVIELNVDFDTGLSVTTAGASTDVTLIYD